MHVKVCFIVCIAFTLVCSAITSAEETDVNLEGLEIQTDSGTVEGTVVKAFTGKDVTVFYGIPYAEPPLNQLRFRAPQPVKPWTGVLKATRKPLPCYQQYSHQNLEQSRSDKTLIRRPWSEDCLTLTIWVPRPAPKDAPVLVLFHPRNFLTGSSVFPNIDGSTLASEATNILVSMNYRLGVFGFLNFGTEDAPGNMGLLDQQLALKWIHQNIHHFGGKTSVMNLYGTAGAGSASVGYHLISEGSAGLFRTVILFSGSPTCPWAFQSRERSLKKAKELSSKLGCSGSDVESKLECMRNIHPEDILDAERSDISHIHDLFIPTVDGTFITEPPIEAFKSGRFNKAVLLVTTEAHEGSVYLRDYNKDVMPDPELGLSLEGFRKAVKVSLPNLGHASLSAVEEFYVDSCSLDDPLKLRDAAVSVYTDALFTCCVNQLVEDVARNNGTVYRVLENLRRSMGPAWMGASHGLTNIFALGYPILEGESGFTKEEASISKEFMEWIDKHTKISNQELRHQFPVFNLKDRPYIRWDVTGPHQEADLKGRECHLLDKIISKLNRV